MNQYHHLSRRERSRIGIWRKEGQSLSEIGRRLGRSTSTISRELKRGVTNFGYCCHMSHGAAKYRRVKANRKRRKITSSREAIIRSGLEDKFSPEQIGAVFEKETGISISTVSIYRWIYRYSGGGKFQLKKKLRRKGKPHRKYSLRKIRLKNRPMIDSRPQSVADRRFYGDWEADLMLGPQSSRRALLVLTERKSKFTLIRPVKNRTAAVVSNSIIKALTPYKVRTITYDNGGEFANYKLVSSITQSKAFFCNPYHAWEKGLVENTIGLLREYFPKKSHDELPSHYLVYHKTEAQLNRRPRKILGFRSPDSFLSNLLNQL